MSLEGMTKELETLAAERLAKTERLQAALEEMAKAKEIRLNNKSEIKVRGAVARLQRGWEIVRAAAMDRVTGSQRAPRLPKPLRHPGGRACSHRRASRSTPAARRQHPTHTECCPWRAQVWIKSFSDQNGRPPETNDKKQIRQKYVLHKNMDNDVKRLKTEVRDTLTTL
jgi:hypothetical protein